MGFVPPPSVNQTVTISIRDTADADIPSNYTVWDNSVVVQPNGLFVTPFIIDGLDEGVSYTVKIVNNCGGQGALQTFVIPVGTTGVPVGTTIPVTTVPITTQPVTTPPVTTQPVTTPPPTTAPVTTPTAPTTTIPAASTTAPITTNPCPEVTVINGEPFAGEP